MSTVSASPAMTAPPVDLAARTVPAPTRAAAVPAAVEAIDSAIVDLAAALEFANDRRERLGHRVGAVLGPLEVPPSTAEPQPNAGSTGVELADALLSRVAQLRSLAAGIRAHGTELDHLGDRIEL